MCIAILSEAVEANFWRQIPFCNGRITVGGGEAQGYIITKQNLFTISRIMAWQNVCVVQYDCKSSMYP